MARLSARERKRRAVAARRKEVAIGSGEEMVATAYIAAVAAGWG